MIRQQKGLGRGSRSLWAVCTVEWSRCPAGMGDLRRCFSLRTDRQSRWISAATPSNHATPLFVRSDSVMSHRPT